ncbi:hydrogenase formation protein HupD [Neosynechococcus sphagnicola sy1]|uniref:Hydrogenase formation protein HupD n=1 Tax=Neosynechococcus sphagnicola sy1 TaxID=1497020 RepID=A0A098TSD0_9CYAN|nr:hydrogenase formation protein HypD [Neosynechococcus sphagnicola]KGF73668.1 hydrogenase formation protein HupD [Neosynechococcus sphagnicola sy1]
MKFLAEFRDADLARQYVAAIAHLTTRPWAIMEVCGGQTHTIVKFGLDQLLPDTIRLIHGPGCPVCVTPAKIIDAALAIARQPQVIFCSFGDMLRVPGSIPAWNDTVPTVAMDLLAVKAAGGDVRIVYSPLDAVDIARNCPDQEVVFFAVGFETTAPATAMAVYQAQQLGLKNFSLLVSHVLVPPAMAALLSDPNCQVQGFLAAGHVCTVMGYAAYDAIATRYQIPIVVTGFEPVDLLQGIYLCLQQLESGQAKVENQYRRSVQKQGNAIAQQMMQEIFEVIPQQWRGLGTIPQSGLGLRSAYAGFDALKKGLLPLSNLPTAETSDCISGQILQGIQKPLDCPAFAKGCKPEHPLGAPMVSSEGACAAYYRYRQRSPLSCT